MEKILKNTLKNILRLITKYFFNFVLRFKIGRFLNEQIILNIMSRTKIINHFGTKLELSVPNGLSIYRADTFSSKEPETLDWIDEIPKGSIFWDIGANVGLYSCYAAIKSKCRVFAFEPSVFNLELLARNIFLNDLTELVTIVPLPLSNRVSLSHMNMTDIQWGGAMSTFGENYGHDGRIMDKVFVIPMIGLNMTTAVHSLNIPQPDYIKMDVDGIEHLILEGGKSILENSKGVLVEINDSFENQSKQADFYLNQAGFKLKEKLHAKQFDALSSAAINTYNQIWVK